MNDAALLQRYALALALVPDPDAAADLFMDAPGEAALRRKAAAWRRAHGLPEAPEPVDLPALTPADEAHARHLAERGRSRRRVKAVGLGGVLVVALVAVVAGARLFAQAPDGAVPRETLARVRTERPVAGPVTQNGLTFAVQEAHATAGRVELWWSASGLGLFSNRKGLAPTLSLNGASVGPEKTDLFPVFPGRVIGRSSYRVITATQSLAMVRLEHAGVRLEVRTDLVRVDSDPEARTYTFDPVIPQGLLGGVRLTSVAVAPAYVEVQTKIIGKYDGIPVDVQADGEPLQIAGSILTGPDGSSLYFALPREGVRSLTIRPRVPDYLQTYVEMPIPGNHAGMSVWQRGDLPILEMNTAGGDGMLGLPGYAVYNGGKYGITVENVTTQQGPVALVTPVFHIRGLPPGAHVDSVTLSWFHDVQPEPITVDLSP